MRINTIRAFKNFSSTFKSNFETFKKFKGFWNHNTDNFISCKTNYNYIFLLIFLELKNKFMKFSKVYEN